MIQTTIAGTLSLAELELKCGTIQNSAICKLVHLAKQGEVSGVKFNQALFAEVEIGEEVLAPKFIRVNPGDNKASIIAAQLAAGRLLIFDEEIFTNNQPAQVMGFR